MRTSVIITLTSAALAAAQGSYHSWHPAGRNEVRAPCPMLNTLANHNFLPHNGKALTLDRVQYALGTALNIDGELAKFLFDFALTTSPEANATTFSLNDLGRHNILEHDASLSRADFFFTQDPISFNASVFAETQSYWGKETVNIAQAAAARLARLHTSNATNPTFTISDLGSGFSVGETAAYMIFFGDAVSGIAKRGLLDYFFEHERLPIPLGWKKPKTSVTKDVLFNTMERVVNATSLSEGEKLKVKRKADLHVGMQVRETF